jgi:hypothetical protein
MDDPQFASEDVMRHFLKAIAIASSLLVSVLPLPAQSKKGGQDSGGGYSPSKAKSSKSTAEINKDDKTVTIPLTRDGNYRFGVQDMSKEPTREIPQGEAGGVIIFQKKF